MQTFIVKIENGNINWGSTHSFIRKDRFLKAMEGKTMTLRLEEPKRLRNLQQNAYYWACVVPGRYGNL